eukprot:gene4356-6164_t
MALFEFVNQKNHNLHSSSSNKPQTIISFRGLKSHMFSHPFDKRMVRLLSQIPFLQSIVRRIYASIEPSFVINNLSNTILVTEDQMPLLHKSLIIASKILDIDPPALYVTQNPIPNAYTLAFMGRKPFIVVHTGLLDLLNEKEVMSVLAHELGHIKCEHGMWVTLLNLIIETVGLVTAGPIVPLKSLLMQWQRAAEFSCDRASLLVAQDPKVVSSVLMKLCGGSNKNIYTSSLNVDAFLNQVKQLEEETATVQGKLLTMAAEQVASHPLPLIRAHEILKWSNSAEYCGLVERAKTIII